MSRRVALKEALQVWEEQIGSKEAVGRHLLPADLYELLARPSTDESREALLGHLSRCSTCLKRLKHMLKAMDEARTWDMALPKAAASDEGRPSGEILTEGRKYSIVIRRSISDSSRGVITVQVEAAFRDVIEGCHIILKDGAHRILLEGTIVNGEVSKNVADLDNIVPQFFVEPGKRHDP